MRLRIAPGKRPTRVAELLRESLANILLTKCADPRLRELTITEVEMSPDLKVARVFCALRQGVDQDQVMGAVAKAMGFIRLELSREKILRTIPEFFFLVDDTLDRAARLEALLSAAKEGSGEKE